MQSSENGLPFNWEKARELANPRPPDLIDRRFSEQAAFIEDESPFSSLLCTRRAGKSYGAAAKLIRAGHKHAGSSSLFIALTRISAERILWKDVLKVINRQHALGATFNETKLTMTLTNGSVIYLLGADTDEEEKQKLLGQKYAAAVVDEGASFGIDLNELIFGILKPAVADYRGTISIVGTPGNLKKGLFYEITKGQDPGTPGRWKKDGWSGHRWNTFRNPHMLENWKAEIADLRRDHPLIEDTPLFKQNYLGQWVIDDSKLVYKYAAGRNDADGLPQLGRGSWSYVLGVDLGYSPDPTAFVVCAYHTHDRVLYVLEAEAELELDVTAVAERIKKLAAKYDFEKMVIDGANKQAVAEMQKRHSLALTPADKTGKADFIELMNGDFIQGYVRLLPGAASLAAEYAELIWNEKSEKREEHPGCANHKTDAALYAWRWAYAYLSTRAPVAPPKHGSEEWQAQNAARAQAEIEAQLARDMEALDRVNAERSEMEDDQQFLY